MSDHKHALNPQQLEAATKLEGPMLVIAGAGTGKTRVVTHRIINLLNAGVPPWKILGVTFTNKAAQEMRERVQGMTHQVVLITTFHSLGARVLREMIDLLGYPRDFTIYDEDDSSKVLKAALTEVGLSEKNYLKPMRAMISNAKNAMESPDEVSSEELDTHAESLFPKIYEMYQSRLRDYGAVDFDDLLFLTAKLWIEHPPVLQKYQDRWHYILIDEYQDTNAAQYTMTKLLAEKRQNLFVVGDPDQSIYSWRGANIKNILNFERDYPGAEVIRLEQNYRSHTNILQAANALIEYNEGRYEKALWGELEPGEKIQVVAAEDDRAEADFVTTKIADFRDSGVSLNDMVIFYRTNAQSRTFEDDLLYRGVPYVIVGGISFYQRREIKDILAYLRVVQSDADFISFARTIQVPKRGLGDTTMEKLRQNASIEQLPILVYIRELLDNRLTKTTLRLAQKQKQALIEYLGIIASLRELSHKGSLKDLVQETIESTGYLDYLREDRETYSERRENLDELITKAIEWEVSAQDPSLQAFLEELSLKSSLDEAGEKPQRLTLMTLHNSKGLEFKIVFMVGVEEGLFPHANSKNSLKELEEERRLCYVGITRAREHLFMSHCRSRYLWGELRFQESSRFLREIPSEYITKKRV